MRLRIGYELVYSFPQPTPVILMVSVHDSRASDLLVPDRILIEPSIPVTCYRDLYGNHCHRIMAPPGRVRFTTDAIIADSGEPDEVVPTAWQSAVEELPDETLVYLLSSR